MGADVEAEAEWNGQRGRGRLLLETDDLEFRGTFRLKIARRLVTACRDRDGWLDVEWGEGERASFRLGAKAARWAAEVPRIKSRIEKMGLKSGLRVTFRGEAPPDFAAEVQALGPPAAGGPEVIVWFVRAKPQLALAPGIASGLKASGALWVCYPKGRPELREVDVLDAGRTAGLVDVKVVRFSETHTALRFVVPKGGSRPSPPGGARPLRGRGPPRARPRPQARRGPSSS